MLMYFKVKCPIFVSSNYATSLLKEHFFSIHALEQQATSRAVTEKFNVVYNANSPHKQTFTLMAADDGIESCLLSWAVISSW